MAINLELPRKLEAVIEKAHQGAAEMLRPIARKWDLREHEYPVELDTLANLFEVKCPCTVTNLLERDALVPPAAPAFVHAVTEPIIAGSYRDEDA